MAKNTTDSWWQRPLFDVGPTPQQILAGFGILGLLFLIVVMAALRGPAEADSVPQPAAALENEPLPGLDDPALEIAAAQPDLDDPEATVVHPEPDESKPEPRRPSDEEIDEAIDAAIDDVLREERLEELGDIAEENGEVVFEDDEEYAVVWETTLVEWGDATCGYPASEYTVEVTVDVFEDDEGHDRRRVTVTRKNGQQYSGSIPVEVLRRADPFDLFASGPGWEETMSVSRLDPSNGVFEATGVYQFQDCVSHRNYEVADA